MSDKNNAISFIKEQLQRQGVYSKNKFDSIIRVQKYANTLCHFVDEVDSEVVSTSALFHNIGYLDNKEESSEVSKTIAKEYLTKEGKEIEFIDKVCQTIGNHNLITDNDDVVSNLSMEDKILIDAKMIGNAGILKAFDVAIEYGNHENYEMCLEKIKEAIQEVEKYIKYAHTKKAKEILIKNYMLLKGLTHTIEAEISAEHI